MNPCYGITVEQRELIHAKVDPPDWTPQYEWGPRYPVWETGLCEIDFPEATE